MASETVFRSDTLHFPFRPYPNSLTTGFQGDPSYLKNAQKLLNYVQKTVRPEHTLFVLGSFQDEFDEESSHIDETLFKAFMNQTDTLLPVFLMRHYDNALRNPETHTPQTLEIILVAPSQRLRNKPPYMLSHKKISPYGFTPENTYIELHMFLYSILTETHEFTDLFDVYNHEYGEDEYSPYYEITLKMKSDVPDGEEYDLPLNAVIRFRWFYTMWIDCVREDYFEWADGIYLPRVFRKAILANETIQTHANQIYATESDFQMSSHFQDALTTYVRHSQVIVLNYAVFIHSNKKYDMYYIEHSIPPLQNDRIITYHSYPIYSSESTFFVNGKSFYTLPQEKRNEYVLLSNGELNKKYQHKSVYGLSHFFGKDLERLMKGGRRYRNRRLRKTRKTRLQKRKTRKSRKTKHKNRKQKTKKYVNNVNNVKT